MSTKQDSNFKEFNLVDGDISTLEIRKSNKGDTCYICSKDGLNYYNKFILDKNSATTTLCSLTFFQSSTTNRFIPRPTFRKRKNNGDFGTCKGESIVISFADGVVAQRFWNLMSFLGGFKELVDLGDFDKKYKVVTSDYVQFFKTLNTDAKIEAVIELIKNGDFTTNDIKSMVVESRKKVLKRFLYLLKNKTIKNEISIEEFYIACYRSKYKLQGDESVWHHFLKENDWILGLNADLRFTSQYVDEAKIGFENTNGKGSPKADFLGIANYTTLIELKTPSLPIFKSTKGGHSRTDTWEFSTEFISGISQCLGQKLSMDESYQNKHVIDGDNNVISKEKVFNADVKVIFIVGCRYEQFPHNGNVDNIIKSKTFELFRRNNRNIDIITYDELFERAYHIVMDEKIPDNWFKDDSFDID